MAPPSPEERPTEGRGVQPLPREVASVTGEAGHWEREERERDGGKMMRMGGERNSGTAGRQGDYIGYSHFQAVWEEGRAMLCLRK